ncbi:tat pathway signal sequence [Colletotrichum cuscutae]|uniref:Tat pathway signal sequence n=1 Tax=Colletotrichum cuscutae TaxID=1209917 RepID=A0AAI9VDH7_9PEZI|nr:tat pathway signal sequence [Colletotrichum cuscutae]
MAGVLWYRGEEWREVWDYWFKWTDEHLTSDNLRPMIYTYDELGAEALDRLDEVSPPVKRSTTHSEKVNTPQDAKPHRDLYALLRDNADADAVLGKLWTEINTIPPWVDWAQIERGQQVFLRYAAPTIFAVTYGVPVNDLDSIGTITTFSSTLLWIGLPRQGIFLKDSEKQDYLALWRYVAYIMGTPTDAFSSLNKARAMMESLLASEIQPSDTSRALANNVLTGLAEQPPWHVSREFLAAETYWLNGPKLARALAVEKPPFYCSLLILGQCLFFMFMCYSRRLFPRWDESRNENLKKALFNITINKPELGALGKETNFEFKYIPTLDVPSTGAAARTQQHPDPSTHEPGSTPADAKTGARAGASTRRVRSNERRSLITLGVVATVGGLLAWLGIRGASALFGRVL